MKALDQDRGYHALSVEETLSALATSVHGLTDYDAQGRQHTYGKNALPQERRFSTAQLLLAQFRSPLMMIVLLAAVFSFVIGHGTDAVFILVVVLINAIVSFFQEYKAETALAHLRQSMELYCRVIRADHKKEIPSHDLVPGDIVEIVAGDRIPADGRVIAAENLEVGEALLTGEGAAVEKSMSSVSEETILPDRTNMVFSGTVAEEGGGRFVVTAIGAHTQIGGLSRLLADQEETATPLQRKFLSFSRMIGAAVIGCVALFSLIGLLRGGSVETIFVTATALVVSAVPEGLLPAITVVLVLGMRRLAKQKALVRRLNANEAMGSITVICLDKTGTLTEGAMHVSHILAGRAELLNYRDHIAALGYNGTLTLHTKVLEIATLVNEAYVENPEDALAEWIIHGRPTDRALLLAGMQAGISRDAFERTHRQRERILFSSAKKYAARIYAGDADRVEVFALGAPEEIIARTHTIERGTAQLPLHHAESQKLLATVEQLARQGLRVLACAHKATTRATAASWKTDEEKIADLILVGFVALKDPLRRDVRDAVYRARAAGIRPIIITGDHRNTAESIMEELGINITKEQIMEGKDVERLSDHDLARRVSLVSIFARVLPVHKIRIVRALQSRGHVVAMVGDGVNDAPALKAADVGIAVASATDITKGVADIVLLDNSFSVIVKAIEQGRLIFDNIRRAVIYLVADDFSELFLFFVSLFFGMPLPLHAAQILWINIVEDTFPNLALTAEKDTKGLMDEPPRDPREPFFATAHKKFMAAVFFVTGMSALAMFLFTRHFTQDLEVARTMTFVLVAFDSLAFAYIVRSFHHTIFSRRAFDNWYLNGAVLISFLILIAGVSIAPLAAILHTVPITLAQWGTIMLVTAAEAVALEFFKYLFFQRRKR